MLSRNAIIGSTTWKELTGRTALSIFISSIRFAFILFNVWRIFAIVIANLNHVQCI